MGLKKIVLHWTAGTSDVSALDRAHYHYVISGAGVVVEGDHDVADNVPPLRSYAAHTLNLNSGSIGVSLSGMARSAERPFEPGPWPINERQIDALVDLVATLCKRHGIAVTRQNVLSHAEVQPTLKIQQRGKWDISWLPGMKQTGDPVAIGDQIRARIIAKIGGDLVDPAPAKTPATVKIGSRGDDVKRVQKAVGVSDDGIFGAKTDAAVRDWQSGLGLTPDEIVGPKSWIEIMRAEKK